MRQIMPPFKAVVNTHKRATPNSDVNVPFDQQSSCGYYRTVMNVGNKLDGGAGGIRTLGTL